MPQAPLRPPIIILIAISAIGPAALNIFIPSMPGLVAAFDTDYATVQLTLTLYLFGLAIAQLVFGPLADRFGRRPVLLAGLGLYCLGSLLAALAPTIEALIAARVLQAIGGCVGLVVARAVVRDVWPRDEAASVLGLVTAAMAIAPAISPSIGGLLDGTFGWRAGFYVLILAGAIVFVASARMLPETAPKGLAVPGVAGLMLAYARVLKSSTFLGYALCSGCCAMAFFAFLAGAPYVVVEHLGYPPVVYGMAFAAISVGYMIGNMTANRLSVRIGAPRMVAYGTVVTILGCIIVFTLAFTGVEGMAALFLPMMLVAIGNGMLQPNAIAAAVSGVDPSAAGTASGAAGCLQMLLGGLATQLVGFLHTGGGALPTGTVMLTGALVGTAFYWLLARRP